MEINEELYEKLLLSKKQKIREYEYIKLCLENLICPNCNKDIIGATDLEILSMYISGDYNCEHCGKFFTI